MVATFSILGKYLKHSILSLIFVMETSFNVKAGIFNFHQRCSGMSMDIAQYLHMLVVAKGHNIMRSQQTIATTVGYLDYLWLREQ